MKLEELLNVLQIENSVVVRDCYDRTVGQCNMTDSIPPFLNDVEVGNVYVDDEGVVFVDLCLENNLPFLGHIRDILTNTDEDLADEYRVASVDDVNKILKSCAEKLEEECHEVVKALSEGEAWDYYLG